MGGHAGHDLEDLKSAKTREKIESMLQFKRTKSAINDPFVSKSRSQQGDAGFALAAFRRCASDTKITQDMQKAAAKVDQNSAQIRDRLTSMQSTMSHAAKTMEEAGRSGTQYALETEALSKHLRPGPSHVAFGVSLREAMSGCC